MRDRVILVMHTRSTYTARTVVFLLLLMALSACLAPSHAPEKTAPTPAVPYESMHDAIALGQPEDALKSYERALAARPQSSATRVLHGRLLMLAGKLVDARQEFTLVLADEPRNTDALYNLSMVAGLEDRGEEQEVLLRKVVEIEPRHADALAALGRKDLDRGQAAEATDLFQRHWQSTRRMSLPCWAAARFPPSAGNGAPRKTFFHAPSPRSPTIPSVISIAPAAGRNWVTPAVLCRISAAPSRWIPATPGHT